MKKSLFLLIPLIITLGACTSRRNTSSNSTEPSSTEPSSTTSSTGPEELNTETQKFVFKGDKSRSGLTPGSQLGTTQFDNALASLMNEGSDGPLQSFDGESCAMQLVGGDSSSDTSLTIGTSKYSGLIYFTFNYLITQIEVEVQGYYNPHHDYQQNKDVTGVDLDAEVTICSYDTSGEQHPIETKNIDLSTEDDVSVPQVKEESLEFNEPANTIAFYNNGKQHRTWIHSLTVTYIME